MDFWKQELLRHLCKVNQIEDFVDSLYLPDC
jgi:hypothetical protein